jgi:hypothetical protein
MTRTAPVPHVNVPTTSQFYTKAETHENQHVANWASGGVLGDLWTVDGLFALLSPLTDSTEQGLKNKIANTTISWDANQTTIFNSRKRADEQAAYAASDPVGPQYLGMWQCQQSRYP